MAKPNCNLPYPTSQEIAKFNSSVDKSRPRSCWIWIGAIDANGNSVMFYREKRTSPIRIAYLIKYRKLPKDKVIGHRCGEKLCCNPDHLSPMTPSQVAAYSFKQTRKTKKEYRTITMQYHRRVMEIHLNRILRDDEVVHHINGDKWDNRIENLEIMGFSEHSRMTNLGKVHSEETREKHRKLMLGNKHALGTIRSQKAIDSSRKNRAGYKHSDETKDKIGNAQKKFVKKHGSRNLGSHRSDVTKKIMSDAAKTAWSKPRKASRQDKQGGKP